jgi:hypothetical protein
MVSATHRGMYCSNVAVLFPSITPPLPHNCCLPYTSLLATFVFNCVATGELCSSFVSMRETTTQLFTPRCNKRQPQDLLSAGCFKQGPRIINLHVAAATLVRQDLHTSTNISDLTPCTRILLYFIETRRSDSLLHWYVSELQCSRCAYHACSRE